MRAEDGPSFADFVSREQAALLRLAVLLAGDRGHAEDLVQTALLKAYRHWPRITRAGEPSAYVRRVLVTTHTSWRRRPSTITAPGDTIEVSARPDIAADGSVSHGWRPVDAPDGAAVLALPPRPTTYDSALQYRVIRQGAELTATMPDGRYNSSFTEPQVAVTRLRPAPIPSAGDSMATQQVQEFLGDIGLPPEDVAFTVVWAGDLPAPGGIPARATVLTATLPSGAVYVTTALGLDMGGSQVGGTVCGSQLRAAGGPVADQTFIVRCSITDMSGHSPTLSSLVVVGPPDAASVRALDTAGQTLGQYPLMDGVAVVPLPAGLGTVQTLTADGAPLLRAAPLGYADLGG